jgi:uncharacterized membrane protein
MQLFLAYFATLLTMALLDAAWLTTMVPFLYRPRLGAMLLPKPVLWAAAAFYLLYGAGIVLFAVLPALKADSLARAALLGAALGLMAYATYDLTNQATLRDWPPLITALDLLWGMTITAAAASGAYLAVSRLG